VKKQSEKAFSVIEVIIAIAIFSVATVSLTMSMVNGLLCRNGIAKHNTDIFKYAFASHIIKDAKSIDDAIRISYLTLPSGDEIKINVAINTTDLKNLFSVVITIDGNRYPTLIANKTWR
jgi:prepilin-type N-terminal cleavage/methylation domain-containing protein